MLVGRVLPPITKLRPGPPSLAQDMSLPRSSGGISAPRSSGAIWHNGIPNPHLNWGGSRVTAPLPHLCSVLFAFGTRKWFAPEHTPAFVSRATDPCHAGGSPEDSTRPVVGKD